MLSFAPAVERETGTAARSRRLGERAGKRARRVQILGGNDGTSASVYSPLELVERLIALLPPPRAIQIVYRGVLAGNATWRAEVVPKPKPETPAAAAARRAQRLRRRPRIDPVGERPSWAELLKRVFAVDGFACLECGGLGAAGRTRCAASC